MKVKTMKTKLNLETALKESTFEKVMERFGYSEKPEPSLSTLNNIFKKWCRLVGYDNVLKRIHIEENHAGPFPVMNSNDFLENWMKHGTSGSCWPSSEALFGVLVHAGFCPERVAGQMLECNDPMDPNHGALIVHLEGAEYYTDPSIVSEEVLKLEKGIASKTRSKAFGIWNTGDGHVWWRPGHSRVAIEIETKLRELSNDFFSYRYEKTKEFSLFNTTLYVRRNCNDGIVTYGRGNILRVDTEGELTAEPIENKDMADFLINNMGLSEEIVARVPLQDVEGANF